MQLVRRVPSDHRVAGSSPAGFKSSTRAYSKTIQGSENRSKNKKYLPKFSHFLGEPLQYPLCSVETRRTAEVYLKQYHAFSCCRKSVSALERRSIVDPSGHSRHPGTDFLVLAFGGAADRQKPAGWISRTAGSFFASLRRIPTRPCRLRIHR